MKISGVRTAGGINNGNEMSNAITPHARAIDNCNPLDITFKEAIEAGITSVCITPGSSNVIGGTAFFAKTYGNNIDSMVVKDPVAMKGALGENPMGYGLKGKAPFSRMGVSMMFRETMYKAKEYLEKKEDPETKNPSFDIRLEALIPVLKKEIPMKLHAHSSDDIMTCIRLAKEFDMDITIDHCTGGMEIIDELREADYTYIVGALTSFRRKPEAVGKNMKLPGTLARAGAKVCITTDAPGTAVYLLPTNVALCVKNGMDYYEGLKAITINAAKACLVDDRVGSIKEGKDADIVVWDGCPLAIASTNVATIISGKLVYEG